MNQLALESQPQPEYRIIPLTKGQFAKVSAAHYPEIARFRWSARWMKMTRSFYALRYEPHTWRTIFMHRQILGLSYGDKRIGDHVNRDTLDNRDENLRIVTAWENAINSGIQRNNSSGFKGISFHKWTGKFQARITIKGKVVSLGYFNTAEVASEAYVAAASVHHRITSIPQ